MVRFVLIGVLVLTLATADAQAATTIKVESRPSPIGAAHGAAMWSTLGVADGLYRLRMYSNGVVRTLHVRPRAVPFDINVGTDARHRTVAVYSRCRSEKEDRVNAEGCSLFEYHVRTGKEERLRGLTPGGVSAFLPAIDGSNLAYAAVSDNGAQPNPHIYLVNTKTRHRTRVSGGPRGSYQLASNGFYDGPAPTALDLSGRRIALIWRHFSPTCSDRIGDYQPLTDVLLTTVGRQARSVSSTGCSDETRLGGLALTEASVLYLGHDDPALRRYDFASGETLAADGYGETGFIAGDTHQLFDIRYQPETTSYAVTESAPAFAATE